MIYLKGVLLRVFNIRFVIIRRKIALIGQIYSYHRIEVYLMWKNIRYNSGFHRFAERLQHERN